MLKRIRAATSEGYVRNSAALPEALHRRLMHASIETRLVATEIIVAMRLKPNRFANGEMFFSEGR